MQTSNSDITMKFDPMDYSKEDDDFQTGRLSAVPEIHEDILSLSPVRGQLSLEVTMESNQSMETDLGERSKNDDMEKRRNFNARRLAAIRYQSN